MSNNLTDNQYKHYTYDMGMFSIARELDEVDLFNDWLNKLDSNNENVFEAARKGAQKTRVNVRSAAGKDVSLINFSSFNYLGFSYHPDVIQAAKDALDVYGMGAAASPILGGTYDIHKELEKSVLDYFDLPGRGVSLFSSGYGVNVGTIQAFMKKGGRVILDRNAHMSLLEGAKACGADISYFKHNDMDALEALLKVYCNDQTRVLICLEGVYSADGDYGNLREVVRLAKKYGAFTLVDEAHSVLIAGNNGRGVSEEHGVLDEVDLYIMTFSKAFGGIGGALLAKKDIVRYVNFYAKFRMFSCALDPAVAGGLIKVLELAKSGEGQKRRQRIKENATYLRDVLSKKVSCKDTVSWVVPVMYYSEAHTIDLGKYIQENGLDVSLMQFPATSRNEARVRLFVSSEHSKEELDEAARIIFKAAKEFNF
jgi:7-keto-8-aminopelargonate synthetase-like enzyme